MDIGKSFTYMFDDEKWVQKLAIGGLLVLVSIIPLVNIFTLLVVVGYSLRVLKNVSDGSDQPLPEWDDWGGDWTKGLFVVLAYLIYSIPVWVISGISWAITAISGTDPGSMEGIGALCTVGLSCLSALWGLFMAIVLPAGTIKYAREGDFGAFFRFGEIFRFIGDNLSNYIVALLLIIVARLVAGLGIIICVVGVFFTGFWSALVTAHLLGQVRSEAAPALAAVAAPAPPAPPSPPEAPTYGELTESELTEDSEDQ